MNMFLRLPKSDNELDISQISRKFDGLIIVKAETFNYGYILYNNNNDMWECYHNIDHSHVLYSKETLELLIKSLMSFIPNIKCEIIKFND